MSQFHWHVTDSHSFPLQVPGFEEVAEKGAYAQDMIYTPADVQDVITYAAEVGHSLKCVLLVTFTRSSHLLARHRCLDGVRFVCFFWMHNIQSCIFSRISIHLDIQLLSTSRTRSTLRVIWGYRGRLTLTVSTRYFACVLLPDSSA